MHHHSHAEQAAPKTRGVTIHWAKAYDRLAISEILTFGKIRQVRKSMIDHAGLQPGDRVLDVGCGPGYIASKARERIGPTGRAVGIDAAPEMIEVARQKAQRAGLDIEFQVALIEKLPFPDNSFDIVMSSLMMHHLPDDLKRQGLAEVWRVLKPGGRVMILDMKRPESGLSRALLPLMLHRGMTVGVQDLMPLLDETGFDQIELSDTPIGMLGFLAGTARKQQASSRPDL